MRPSKLRFPERTAATTRSFSSTALEICAGSGPEFPMHVVHPYPTISNFSSSRYGKRSEVCRYSVTTFEPGARLVLTCGATFKPLSTAFFASSPAPIMTDGFEVFVQLVIAAMTAEPCVMEDCWPSRVTVTAPSGRSSDEGAPGDSGYWIWSSPSLVTPVIAAGGSLAGNDSSDASSGEQSGSAHGSSSKRSVISANAARKVDC